MTNWPQHAERLEQRIRELEAENASLKEQLAERKTVKPERPPVTYQTKA